MTDEKTRRCRFASVLLILVLLVPLGGCSSKARVAAGLGILTIALIPHAVGRAIGDEIFPDDPLSPSLVRRHTEQLDSAACGDRKAPFVLANNYREGVGTDKDPEEAYFWYGVFGSRLATEEQSKLGQELSPEARAQADARVAAWTPRDCPRDIGRAHERRKHLWDLYLANCGNIWGPRRVAKNYWLGQGIEENPQESYFWYGMVVKEWDLEAANNRRIVGNLLTAEERAEIDARVAAWAPRDCPKDAKPDFLRLRHLADLDRAACGNVWAQLQVAKDYKSGYGTEENPKESYFWFGRAAEDWGFHRAAFEREILAEELTTEERAEIDARIAAWVPPDCPSNHATAAS